MSVFRRAWQRLARLEPFPQPAIVPVRYPVVLMHGMGLLAAVWRRGQMHALALDLRRRGVRAYAPNVAPYNPIDVRARMWKRCLEQILEENGASKLNLVAHSMGGLDARYLIHELGMHDAVASLVTIATPHHGSTLADVLLDRPSRLLDGMVRLFDWMGNSAMPDVQADASTVLRQMKPSFICERFNPYVPDHPSVRYWSYAGAAGVGTDVPINPFLLRQNRWIHAREGINDGYVSVESARWGTFLGTLPADHLQQIGLKVTPNRRFDAQAFYASLVARLAREGY